MGDIIIANMKASLTLDMHDFDETLRGAEGKLDSLMQKARGGEASTRANVGNDSTDKDDSGQHQQRVQRTHETAQAALRVSEAHESAGRASKTSADIQVAELQRIGVAAADYHSTRMQEYRAQQAALEEVAAKQRRIVVDQEEVTRRQATPGGVQSMERIRAGTADPDEVAYFTGQTKDYGTGGASTLRRPEPPTSGVLQQEEQKAVTERERVIAEPYTGKAGLLTTDRMGIGEDAGRVSLYDPTAGGGDVGKYAPGAHAPLPDLAKATDDKRRVKYGEAITGDAEMVDMGKMRQQGLNLANPALLALNPDLAQKLAEAGAPPDIMSRVIGGAGGAADTTGASLTPGVGVDADKDIRHAAIEAASTRAAMLRVRQGLPPDTNMQVDDEGNPLTNEEYRTRNGTVDTTKPARNSQQRPQSIQSQRFNFLQNEMVAPVAGFLGQMPGGGEALTALSAFAGPAVAATAAATLLGVGLTKAAQAALEYEKTQVVVSASLKNLPDERKAAFRGLMGGEAERGLDLGFGVEATERQLAMLARQGMRAEEAQRVVRAGQDVEREGLMGSEQYVQGALGTFRGGGSGFARDLGTDFYDNMMLPELLAKTEREHGGAAAARREDADVQLAKAGENLHESFTKLGEGLMPVITGFAELAAGVTGASAGLLDKLEHGVEGRKGGTGGISRAEVLANSTPLEAAALVFANDKEWDEAGARVMARQRNANPAPAAKELSGPDMAAARSGSKSTADGSADKSQWYQGNPQVEVSAIRQISDEIMASEAAIGGIQDVFSELTTFHVDFGEVKPQLDNLLGAIEALQGFWLAAIKGKQGSIQNSDYGFAKTYLEMTAVMIEVMDSGADLMGKLYMTSQEMPTKEQMKPVQDRVVDMFEWAKPIAEKALQTSDPAVNMGKLEAWSKANLSLMMLMGTGADTLNKIYSMPMPTDTQVEEAANKVATTISGFSHALVKALYTETGGHGEDSRPPGSEGGISLEFSRAAAVVEGAGKLMAIVGPGIDNLAKMRTLYIPDAQEIAKTATAAVSFIPTIARALKAGETTDGLDPPTLKKYGDMAEQEIKMLGIVTAGIGALSDMRTLAIPDAGRIGSVVAATMTLVGDTLASLPKPDPSKMADAEMWAKGMGPVMGVLQASVQVQAGLRDLAPPGKGQISTFVSDTIALINQMEGELQTLPAKSRASDNVKAWGESMGPVFTALSTAVQLEQQIRDLRPPNKGEIVTAAHVIVSTIDEFGAELQSLPATSTVGDNIEKWGRSMGPAFEALTSGLSFIQEARDTIVPSRGKLVDIEDALMFINGKVAAYGRTLTPETAKQAEEAGKALQATFSSLLLGEQVIQGVVNTPHVAKDQVTGLFSNLDEIAVQYAEHVKIWEAAGHLHQAKFGKDIKDMLEPIKLAEDVINNLGVVRFDFSGPIDTLFDNMGTMIVQFDKRSKTWKESISEATRELAISVGEEMEALGKALDPLAKMEEASRVSHGMIDRVFDAMKYSVVKEAEIGNMPELKGDAGAHLLATANMIAATFTPLKTAVDAIDAMSKPISGQNENAWLARIKTTIGHMGTFAGPGSSAGVVGGGNAATPGGSGGGVYNNCVIIDGGLVIGGEDGREVARIIAKHNMQTQGGVPVNRGSRS